jgi:HSP20 family protein
MSVPRKAPRSSLTDISLLQREINQLFERMVELDRTDRPAAGEWFPSVDVYECRGRLLVVAEVPGLSPESIKVVYRNRSLVITGERREKRASPGPLAFLCMERPNGRFTRTIPLDIAVDIQQAQARVGAGLLTITVPRLRDRRGKDTVIPVEPEEEAK